MKSGLRLSYSKAGRQKGVGENLFTGLSSQSRAGAVSAPVRDPSEEEREGECAQNPRGLIKCGLFTQCATPSSILVSLLQGQQNMGANKKGCTHAAPAVKGGGEEGKGKDE